MDGRAMRRPSRVHSFVGNPDESAASHAGTGTGTGTCTGTCAGMLSKPKSETVQVVVRCRPMSLKERTQGHTQIIDMWPQQGIVYISNPKRSHGGGCVGKTFAFDSVYDWNANQDDLYKRTVQPLVYSVLDGFNGTIFAYGQTGTGKTYTMLGSRVNPKEKGIIAKCFEEIFSHIAYDKQTSYVVRASYFEIYQEETRDLLSPDTKKKPLREDIVRGVYVKGLQSVVCKNLKAIEKVMRIGNMNRATAATNMNEHSSRSHAVFQITVEMRHRVRQKSQLQSQTSYDKYIRVGKLNLVDLAGSERQCKTGAVGERLKESGKINLSLSALGNVISALVNGKSSHIPYRDSKLTQILQDSLGGNSKSIMIANIGPASYNYDESLMTLRYASRAKHVCNHPVRHQDDLHSVISHHNHYNEDMRTLKRFVDNMDQDRAGTGSRNRTIRTGTPTPIGVTIGTGTGTCSSNDISESSEHVTDESQDRVSPSSTTPTSSTPAHTPLNETTNERGAGDGPKIKCAFRSKSRLEEIRKRRIQTRGVWRLRGKYHQETTVKMVKWLQEQMAQSLGGRGKEKEMRTGEGETLSETVTPLPKQCDQPTLTQTELSTQKLIDDLSYLVRRKNMLESIAQLSEENRKRRKQVRALSQLAAEVRGLRERTHEHQQQEKLAVLSEKRRLLRELALRSAVVRSYFAEGDHRRITCCCYDSDCFDQRGKSYISDSCVHPSAAPGCRGDADAEVEVEVEVEAAPKALPLFPIQSFKSDDNVFTS